MSDGRQAPGRRSRRPLLVRAVLAGLAAAAIGGSRPAGAQARQVDGNLAVILVRDAIAALNQANLTGNYTVLRDYASPNFASVNDPAKLAGIFAPLRSQDLNLAPTLILAPQFTRAEMTDDGSKLRLTGIFPSRPKQVNFDLVFEPIGGRWRLFGISVAAPEPRQEVIQVPAPAAPPTAAAPAPSTVPIPMPRPLD